MLASVYHTNVDSPCADESECAVAQFHIYQPIKI